MSLILILILLIVSIRFLLTKYKLYLTGWHIPGPWALPIVGNVQMVNKLKPQDLFQNFTENRVRFKHSYRLWLGPQLWVFLHSPEETRDALNDPSLVKPDTFKQLHLFLGNGLLISEGKYWETHRRSLGPAFQPNILYSFIPAISHHATILVEKLEKNFDQSIEVSSILFPCVLDTIIDTSMGKSLSSQSDPHDSYMNAFHHISELLFKRMVNPLLSSDFIFEHTNNYRELKKSLAVIFTLTESVIQERALYLRDNSESTLFDGVVKRERKARTLLDTLLSVEIDGKTLSFQEIRDEVNTFVFAGVDTTTAAMSFVLYALAKFPAEQTKVYQEIINILPPDRTDFAPTIGALNNLVYLDLFLKEVLRFYTIVPMTGRQTTKDTKLGDTHYCAGVTIWINMYGLAHDPAFFENPAEFRPERFSKEESAHIPAFAYIPFSGGPHVCIGKKYSLLIMKVLTLKIVQQFEIHLSSSDEEMVLMARMVLKSLNGINLRFKPRNNKK